MSQPLEPTHLSLFALAQNTGHPIARMPVYAEVAVTAPAPVELPPGNVDQRLDDPILQAIRDADPQCFASMECRDRLHEAMRQALSRLLTQEARDRLTQGAGARAAVTQILRRALAIAGGDTLGNLDADTLLRDLRDAIRSFADANGLGLVGDRVPDVMMVWAHPLGILATDHVGYLSFDLTRLPPNVQDAVATAIEARRHNPPIASDVSVWVYPMVLESQKVDALSQGRFAHDAILVKLYLEPPALPEMLQHMGLLAMQNPDLTDWRLSPASFAVNPASLIGEHGCETLLPANVALQEFYFYQVVRLNDVEANAAIPANLRTTAKAGIIHEYRLAWYPLGHSLGQILYSLPLAPGESVNLAVVDWTRRDDAQRAEHTTMDEQLVHNEHRDRTITETVNAAIQEYQKGSSFMAGLAGSVGVGVALGAGAGLAAGLAGSLGGSSANSSGSRTIAGTTVQNLSDNISQASASKRELQSTVVVHSVQAEHEAIETRTVVNYNHSHAMTMLYYEVLRHFRVVTERSRSTAALLVDYPLQQFFVTVDQNVKGVHVHYRVYTDFLRDNRALLRAGLLDQKYAAGFDALERIEQRAKAAAHTPAVAPPATGSPIFRFFNIDMKTGGLCADRNENSGARVHVKATLLPTGLQLNSGNELWNPGAFGQKETNNSVTASLPVPPATVAWSDIDSIQFLIDLNFTWVSFQHIKVTGVDVNDVEFVLIDKDYRTEGFVGDFVISDSTDFVLPTRRPSLPAPSPSPAPSADEINDRALLDELLDHLDRNKEYYNRIVWLGEDPLARATRFDAQAWDGSSTLLDHLENRAVEIIGSWVAFPTAEKKLTDLVLSLEEEAVRVSEGPAEISNERLVTLPTRGVFAEAKLGHCNASEEIDNTRFWDWQQSPIPHFAPEIAPVTPVTPQPVQPNLQPTPFPQSLVNIVNPPSAPDPTGLAAAFGALATPNIFRDMSGLAQVGSLLQKLSDNTIGIAQASNQARKILAGSTTAGAGAGLGTGGGAVATPPRAGGAAGGAAAPMQPNEQHDRIQVVRNAVDQGNITPEEGNQKISKILDAGTPLLGFALDAGAADAGAAGALNPGNFKRFVDAGRLDLEVADALRELDGYPGDSWAKQTATFVYHELDVGNLYGILSAGRATNVTYLKSQIPATFHANLDNEVARINGGRYNGITTPIGTPGAYKGYTLLKDTLITSGTTPGASRDWLMVNIAHELTHFRNRDYYVAFDKTPPSDSTLYVDLAKAQAKTETQRLASLFMQEIICKHVAWRVQKDLDARARHTPVPANPDKKAFFRYVLDQSGAVKDNDYLADITAANQYNRQAAIWMRRAGQNSLFFDGDPNDPTTKNAAVRKFFEDTYNEVQPGFATPTVSRDGLL